jgi:hypothetical protein
MSAANAVRDAIELVMTVRDKYGVSKELLAGIVDGRVFAA